MKDFNALSIQARLVIVAFGIAAVCSAGWAMLSEEIPSFGSLVVLVSLGAVTSHVKVKLSKTATLSLLTSVVMLALMMEGMLAAAAVGVVGVTVQAFLPSRKFMLHRFVFNAAMVILAIHAASIPYHWLGSLAGIAAASLTYYLGNSLSVSLIVAATECKSMFRVWHDHFFLAAPSFLSSGLLSLVAGQIPTHTLLGLAIMLPLLYISYRAIRIAAEYPFQNRGW